MGERAESRTTQEKEVDSGWRPEAKERGPVSYAKPRREYEQPMVGRGRGQLLRRQGKSVDPRKTAIEEKQRLLEKVRQWGLGSRGRESRVGKIKAELVPL